MVDDKIQQIRLIKLDSRTSHNLAGCKSSTCEYNVEQLPKGLYKVSVKTNHSFFEETISVD